MSSASPSRRRCPICGTETEADYCEQDGTRTLHLGNVTRDPLRFQPGDFVARRYRILRAVGRGGYGAVYAAEHTGTRQLVAVKLLTLDPNAAGAEMVRRFFQEAQITAQLRAENTVRLFDVDQDDGGSVFLVMELLEGPTLEQVLRTAHEEGTFLSEAQALNVAIPVLRSLEEAHRRGLVHRDLKPANIVLAKTDEGAELVKVVDFGIARTRDSSLTTAGKTMGTPTYMSPEQCEGTALDGRSDLYSLGVILWRCVVGEPPFAHESPLGLMYQHRHAPVPDLRSLARVPVSDGFVACVERLLRKDPEARFPNATALRAVLEAVLGGSSAAALPWPPEASPVALDETPTNRLTSAYSVRSSQVAPLCQAPAAPAPSELTGWLEPDDVAEDAGTAADDPLPRLRTWPRMVTVLAAVVGLGALGLWARTEAPMPGKIATAQASLTPTAPDAGAAAGPLPDIASGLPAEAQAVPAAPGGAAPDADAGRTAKTGPRAARTAVQRTAAGAAAEKSPVANEGFIRATAPGKAGVSRAEQRASADKAAADKAAADKAAADKAAADKAAADKAAADKAAADKAAADKAAADKAAADKAAARAAAEKAVVQKALADQAAAERTAAAKAAAARALKASRDAECRSRKACERHGLCTSSGPRCMAVSDKDCKESQECRLGGRCRADRGACIE